MIGWKTCPIKTASALQMTQACPASYGMIRNKEHTAELVLKALQAGFRGIEHLPQRDEMPAVGFSASGT